jgi:hypothetical protein
VGSFAARSTLNDAFHPDATAMMQCCNAAGTRGLYDLWRYAVQQEAAPRDEPLRLTLQLRFSVETPALRVISYEPSEGRLDILPKQDARLAIRLPPGASQATVVTQPGARTCTIDVCQGTIALDVRADQALEVRYPLRERTAEYRVGTPERFLECTGYWRGETLMRLDPPGTFYPLYARQNDLLPVQPSQPAGPLIHSLATPRNPERRGR